MRQSSAFRTVQNQGGALNLKMGAVHHGDFTEGEGISSGSAADYLSADGTLDEISKRSVETLS